MYLRRYSESHDTRPISSGSILLDRALGGGYSSGRIVEISGNESSSKSVLALHAVKQVQNQNRAAVYIDVDRKIGDAYLSTIGIDKDKVHFAHPLSLDETIDLTGKLLEHPFVDLIVIDNVSNLIAQENIDNNIIDYNYGVQNKLFNDFVYNLSYKTKVNNTAVVFVNQYRTFFAKGGRRGGFRPLYSNLFQNFATTRVSLKRASTVKHDLDYTGDRIEATIHKSSNAYIGDPIEFDVEYSHGIDNMKEIIDLAVELEILRKSGAWYAMGERTIGQGIEDTKNNLLDNKELFDALTKNIQEKENDYEFIRQYKIR